MVTPWFLGQVKTHAQKYFLKLARQSLEGESGGGGQEGGSDEGPAAEGGQEKDYGDDGEVVDDRSVLRERGVRGESGDCKLLPSKNVY